MRSIIGSCVLTMTVTACALFTDLGGYADSPPADAGTDVDAPTALDLGNGRDGRLEAIVDVTPNAYLALSADVPAGATRIPVDNPLAIADGDLVIVWQVGGLAQPAVGLVSLIPEGSVTRWELARARGSVGNEVVVDKPLAHSYAGSASQVVRVPQYTEVVVRPTARIRAVPWDGRRGGIVAFVANGPVVVEGAISADGAGFRGGLGFTIRYVGGCTAADGYPIDGFAAKGEGLYAASYAASPDGRVPGGRASSANGGGGGNCSNAGGGGGGGSAQGGNGGQSFSGDGARPVGGQAGAGIVANPLERFAFGGGGGAGESDSGKAAGGGAGGGVLFVRALRLQVSGTISARGVDGETSLPDGNGGSGGGGGGAMFLDVAEDVTCSSRIEATGGAGGNASPDHGPGGGGGGGIVLVRSKPTSCQVVASGGKGGTHANGAAYGATAGTSGPTQLIPR